MIECLDAMYRTADQRLQRVYDELIISFKHDDTDKLGGITTGNANLVEPDTIKTLRSAERAWIRFRDANCDWHHSLGYGGTISSSYGLSCMIELTEQRTAELEKELSFLSARGAHSHDNADKSTSGEDGQSDQIGNNPDLRGWKMVLTGLTGNRSEAQTRYVVVASKVFADEASCVAAAPAITRDSRRTWFSGEAVPFLAIGTLCLPSAMADYLSNQAGVVFKAGEQVPLLTMPKEWLPRQ